jgi:hypothetical protein
MRKKRIQEKFIVQSAHTLKCEGRNAEGVVNYLLAAGSRALFENPTIAPLVNNFIVLYGIWRCITIITTAQKCILL